jgi:Transposase DDE domain
LAGLICGIVSTGSCHLPKVALKVPGTALVASREKRISRCLRNDAFDAKTYFLPFARMLLSSLPHLPLVLVIDGSLVGRGCVALMVALVYRKRALPLAWMVSKGKKGHFSEDAHMGLVREVATLIPADARVVFLGDGEFDGCNLQALLRGWGWQYVCRTACNVTLQWEGETFQFEDMAVGTRPGDCVDVPNCLFTHKRYGPVLALCWWRRDCKEPIFLVSNMASPEDACELYGKRFHIETFFSDEKSRGFNLHKSHLSDPARLSRLMIGACLAYHWIIYLGCLALQNGWQRAVHRSDRCDLSLFQLGLRLLDYLLERGWRIPYAFWDLHRTGSG